MINLGGSWRRAHTLPETRIGQGRIFACDFRRGADRVSISNARYKRAPAFKPSHLAVKLLNCRKHVHTVHCEQIKALEFNYNVAVGAGAGWGSSAVAAGVGTAAAAAAAVLASSAANLSIHFATNLVCAA